MRCLIWIFGALALAACSPADKAPPAPADHAAGVLPEFGEALSGRIVAVGANPGWRLDADREVGIVFTASDPELVVSANYVAPRVEGARANLVSGELDLTLANAPCTLDGAAYPMSATLNVRGFAHTGCAFVRWDRDLSTLLPAIDACLSLSTDETPLWVSYAGNETDSIVLVRMRNADGAYDCRVSPAGEDADMAPTDPALRIGGDNAAIFVRAPGENPGGQCYAAPEERDANGALIGWWADPEGC